MDLFFTRKGGSSSGTTVHVVIIFGFGFALIIQSGRLEEEDGTSKLELGAEIAVDSTAEEITSEDCKKANRLILIINE